MRQLIKRFVEDEAGASAIEYGLVASLIAVNIIGALNYLGLNLRDRAIEIADALLESGR